MEGNVSNVFAVLVAMENALNFNLTVKLKKQMQLHTVTSWEWESGTAYDELAMQPAWIYYAVWTHGTVEEEEH